LILGVSSLREGIGMQRVLSWLVTAAAAAAAWLVLLAWMSQCPPLPAERRPAPEGSLAEVGRTQAVVNLSGTYRAFSGEWPAAPSAAWPGFRGPARDNCAAWAGALLESWPTQGPPVLWQVSLGEGHAAPAVRDGRVYLLDYDEVREGDLLRCFALETGRELWQRGYAVKTKRNHGISRTIPAVDDECVVTLGPQCHVICVTATNGAFRWGLDLVRQYGARVPLWWAGQCPLLDAGEAVLAPAGRALLIGVDRATGRVTWETPNPEKWEMSHASLMIVTAGGVRQFVYAAIGGIAGVAADGAQRGRLLWQTKRFAPTVVAPSPLPLPDGRFFMTAGYGAGGVMFRITRQQEQWQVEELFRTDRTLFGSEQQTPIFRDGLLYAVLPNDAGEHRQELACLTLDGALRWTSGREHRFGLGPYLSVGNRFFLLDDEARLSLMAAEERGCRLLARAELLPGTGRDAWGPMAFVDGRLLVRDSRRLICLDLRAPAVQPPERGGRP
jgi:outer membrane protein assembly factor BamB